MNVTQLVAKLQKHLVVSIATTLAVVFFGLYAYRNGALTETDARLDESTQLAARLKTNIINATSLPEQVEALVSANAIVADRLVRSDDRAKNVQYFYEIEALTGVKIHELRQPTLPPQKGDAAQGMYMPVPYSLKVTGNYSQLLAFIRRLEQGSCFCRMLGATCGPSSSDASADKSVKEMQLSLNLDLELLGRR